MKQSVASGNQALFAYRSEGRSELKGELNFIQLNNSSVSYNQRKGSMYWKGKNKSAADNAAKNSSIIYFK